MSNTVGLKNDDVSRTRKTKVPIYWLISLGLAVLIVLALIFAGIMRGREISPFSFLKSFSKSEKKQKFEDKFNKKSRQIEETGKMSESSSKSWWVNSGGWVDISGGTGKTIQGTLAEDSKWKKNYEKNNPEDTDNGSHPQNIFRLVTREKWQNFRQQAYFRITKINLSESENRNESNGILLFNRYKNEDDLYYTGLRVDGYAVIKKKIDGDYHTLVYEKVYDGAKYDRDGNPNLLPIGKWIGLRSEVVTNKNGDVEISVYRKKGRKTKKWKLTARYVDKGQKGDRIMDSGYGGIRTDFMDVEFDKYKITEL
jgi:hypothetical protein